jgi:hypothetical protein
MTYIMNTLTQHAVYPGAYVAALGAGDWGVDRR